MYRNRGSYRAGRGKCVVRRTVHRMLCAVCRKIYGLIPIFKIQDPLSGTPLLYPLPTTLYTLFLTFALPLSSATLSLKLSPENPYVGEPVFAVLTLHDDKPLGAVRFSAPPSMEGLRIERLEADRTLEVPDDGTRRRFYRILPLKEGSTTLPAFGAALQRFDPVSRELTWERLETPSRAIHVRPLPPGVPLAGNLTIRLTREENGTLDAGAPLHLTLEISGRGDLELLPPLGWEKPDLAIYADRPRIRREFNATDYRELWNRRFVIVTERSTILPPLRLKVLNPATGLVETLATQPLRITVHPRPLTSREFLLPLGTFLLGLISGGGLLLLRIRRRHRPGRTPLAQKIRSARNDRELYEALLPLAHRHEFAPFLRELEENLYRQGKNRIDRKNLLGILEKIENRNTHD